ncbi:serine hydrolase domain-containing protein [Virgisporangium aliadipatigenens]|uniref:serine hydrolase domain-containing protein n=1 Tax=Virgisporangium aliadipatigenens TaxID=741659 RepID=UPI0019423B6D|nr:serine hydrolase domain-containing protein [Virgisporangium aliadipatigenens]
MSATARRLEREVRKAQAHGRIPAVSVAVHRDDRPLWTFQVGSGEALPAGADTRFRIGSVTKTFTAVLLMQLRDEGALDLDDPLDEHLDVPTHGTLTLARLLSHSAGLQREPYGDVWDTLATPEEDSLLADLARAERVLPTGRRFHYSNLAFALLGEVVATKRGTTWAKALTERVLTPLRLTATTLEPPPQAAVGYLVDEYSDHARPEPNMDCRALSPAAQLWSTAADMAKWAAFLADPAAVDPEHAVLAADTVDEMRYPRTVTDEARWGAAFGLGLLAIPQKAHRVVHVGHDGAMPGFLAAVYGRRPGDGAPGAFGAAALGSSGTGADVLQLPHTLLTLAAEHDPVEIEPWTPGEPAPHDLRSILGRWWGEGFEYVFFWRDGKLRSRGVADDPARPPATFVPVEGRRDMLRTESGREAGELLRLTRDAVGTVVRMHWATYRFTRRQETFDTVPASEPDPS